TLVPPVVSESFGSCEEVFFSQAEQTLMRQAAAEGIAFFVSSGDWGAECAMGGPNGTVQESGRAEVMCPACYDGVTGVRGSSYTNSLIDSNGNLIAVSD